MATFRNNGNQNRPNGLIIWLMLTLIVGFMYQSFNPSDQKTDKIIFSELLSRINDNSLKEATINGEIITARTIEGEVVTSFIPRDYSKLLERLEEKKISIEIQPTETATSGVIGVLLNWVPALLLLGYGYISCVLCKEGAVKL